MVNNLIKRREKILESISSEADAFLITNIKNIRYLTGFTGSFAIFLCTNEENFLFVDFRYTEQAKKEVDVEIVEFKNSWLEALKKIIRKKNIKKLSFESSLTYETYKLLAEIKKISFIPESFVVEKIRALKDKVEIKNIKEAVKRAERAFLEIKPYIKQGESERNIAIMLEYELKKQGSETLPFPVIVASGYNASMPHWRNSERILKKGDFVIIDWGAEYKGYYSDMTRTFIVGKPSKKQIEIYEIVNKARIEAIKKVSAGVMAKKIDAKARNLIKQSGYGENFGHATGHGVGIDVHELPRINTKSEEIIQSGMVFTIEPGIYIEGLGGVRIEDMILVKNDSVEILTNLSTELETL